MTSTLSRLYLIRFAFAVVWAGLMFASADDLGTATTILLVIYPAFDVAAALVDLKDRSNPLLYANIAISTAAAVGLGIAGQDSIPNVLRVWGAWAVLAGLIQLAVGISRRHQDGHWPMILSGGMSALVGIALAASAANAENLTSVAGYATLGGIFFLVSALRLRRSQRAESTAKTA